MRRLLLGAALAACIGLAGPAIAETKPENIQKYRHAVMDAMKGHVSAIALLAFNQVPDDGNNLGDHANALASLGQELELVFVEGSIADEHSRALPAIWEQPEKFAEALNNAADATAAFAEAVEGGNRRIIASSFRSVGDACKNCHESFRAEEDDH